MASAVKKVNKITQIVRFKQVMNRGKYMSLKGNPVLSSSSSDSGVRRPTRSGSIAVYVGSERRRFVIPTRFMNLPIFVSLLNKAEEEFGFQIKGGIVLPCEVGFFTEMVKLVVRDEQRFGKLDLDEFLKIFSEVSVDSCKDTNNTCHGFTPLLQKTRVRV